MAGMDITSFIWGYVLSEAMGKIIEWEASGVYEQTLIKSDI